MYAWGTRLSRSSRLTANLGLAALVAIAIGVPIALAYASGAMEIPRIDDWAFTRVAVDLYSTGHFRLVGWGEMTMIGHELWGVPFIALFGRSITVLHWAGAVAAALGLAGTFLLYRRFVNSGTALLGAATIAVLPAFAVLSTTYMTDLTSYAGEVVCLTLGVTALRSEGRRSSGLLAASVLVGFWAFSCRELSVAAPVAVLLGYALRERRNGRSLRVPIALLAGLLVAAGALYAWRKGLPGDQATPVVRPGVQAVGHAALVLADSYFAVALALLPILFLCGRGVVASIGGSRGARWVTVAVAVAGVLLVAVPHYPTHDPTTVLDGTVFGRYGTGGPQITAMGARSPLFPDLLWLAINLIAAGVGAAFAGVIWSAVPWKLLRRRRVGLPSTDVATVLLYTAITVGVLAFRAVERGFLIDRYLITLTAASGLMAMLVLQPRGPVSLWRGLSALMVLSLVAAVVVLDANSYDTTRWSAGQHAVSTGVPPTEISAGYEWNGAHYPGVIPSADAIHGYPANCVVIAFQPVHNDRLKFWELRTYAPIGGVFQRRFLVYREPRLCPKPG